MPADPLDWVSVLGFAVGAIGLAVAIYQTYSMRKVRELTKRSSSDRCKSVIGKTIRLARNARDACGIVDSVCAHRKEECSRLRAKVDSIATLADEFMDFCTELNEGHKAEFGSYVDDQLAEKLQEVICSPGRQERTGEGDVGTADPQSAQCED